MERDNVLWKKYTLDNDFFSEEVCDKLKKYLNNNKLYDKIASDIFNTGFAQKHSNYLFFYKPPEDSNALCYNLDTHQWLYHHHAVVQDDFSKKLPKSNLNKLRK